MIDCVGVVLPTHRTPGGLSPLAVPSRIGDGFWGRRLDLNRRVTIPHGFAQLGSAGNLDNLRLAAGTLAGAYRSGIMFTTPFPFLDSDVYKWLEAVGWELGRGAGRGARGGGRRGHRPRRGGTASRRLPQQLRPGARRWPSRIATCAGATSSTASDTWSRRRSPGSGPSATTGCCEVARAGRRPSIDRELGPVGATASTATRRSRWRSSSCTGSPASGVTSTLARAGCSSARGHGLLGEGRFGAPLLAGPPARARGTDGRRPRGPPAVPRLRGGRRRRRDSATRSCSTRSIRRWDEMLATRTYLTGAIGSRHHDEAFGEPFELPPDRAYAETCAAIASVHARLAAAARDRSSSDCADVIERTMYNAVLAGLSLDGRPFFYVNPLQRREGPPAARVAGDGVRAAVVPLRLLPAEPDADASARGSSTSRRPTRAGSRFTSTRRRT